MQQLDDTDGNYLSPFNIEDITPSPGVDHTNE